MKMGYKEVTEWNGEPRDMWVWDNDNDFQKNRAIKKVIYIYDKKDNMLYPVITVGKEGTTHYQHCAELADTDGKLSADESEKVFFEKLYALADACDSQYANTLHSLDDINSFLHSKYGHISAEVDRAYGVVFCDAQEGKVYYSTDELRDKTAEQEEENE